MEFAIIGGVVLAGLTATFFWGKTSGKSSSTKEKLKNAKDQAKRMRKPLTAANNRAKRAAEWLRERS